jgi:hypothetical protein
MLLLLPCFVFWVENRNGLINDPYLWKVTGAIIMVAVVGKFLGSALAAKICWTKLEETVDYGLDDGVNGIDCVKHRVRAQGSDS